MLTKRSMIRTFTRAYSTTLAPKASPKPWANFPTSPFDRTTKLPNNLTVVSRLLTAESVGFTINLAAGSRYEQQPGTAHFLKNALFLSNKIESSIALARLQELRAAQTSVSLTRDLISVTFQCPLEHLDEVIATAGAMFKPRLLENYEMEQLQERVHFDRDIAYIDVKAFLIDRAHEVAFRKGLGNPVICSETNEGKVEAGQIFDHFQKSFIRQGSSAVSYGVDPSFFEELLARNFSDLHFSRFGTIPQLPAKYYGGEARYDRNYNNNVALLAYPSRGGVSNLQHLLMTKIIMQVLSPVPSVKYGNALNQLASGAEFLLQFQEHHSDTSLIGFFVGGNQIKDALKSLRHNLGTVDTLISHEQFEAAKSKVVFDLLSATENRASYLQQTSEKIAASGKSFDFSDMVPIIESVKIVDIRKTASDIFKVKPTLVSTGNLQELPYLDEI